MACPTCDHTMQAVAYSLGTQSVFWCPRCGTLKNQTGEVSLPRWIQIAQADPDLKTPCDFILKHS